MPRLVLNELNAAAVGITTAIAAGLIIGASATRISATTSMVSELCVQPTSVGWLFKEIIKGFRLRRSADPAL